MRQQRASITMSDASPDILSRLTPSMLVFHWTSAAIYTGFLGAIVVWVFFNFHRYPATFTPDQIQAQVRTACLVPLLIFCFVSIAVQRLAPFGVMPSMVFLATTLALWIDTAAASLYYGLTSNLGPEWIMTGLMVVTTMAVLLTAMFGALFGYRARQQKLATTDCDALTSLLNRTGFLKWYGSLPPGEPCTIVFMDLNQLKTINDTSGHGAGDAYIRMVGQSIDAALSGPGCVCRWGGDEFCAIVPALSEAQVVNAIETLLGTTPPLQGNLPAFAYGTSTLKTGEPLERSLATADQRMYEHKERQHELIAEHVQSGNAVEEVSRKLELLRTSEDFLTFGLPLVAKHLQFDGTFYVKRTADTWVVTNLYVPAGQPIPIKEGLTQMLNEGLIGRAYRTQTAIWNTDYSADPDASLPWIEDGLKTTIIAPVRCRGDIVGFIYLCSFNTWRSITPQVRRMTETIALRLGHVLDLERVEQEVRATLEGGLLGLGAALEARDLETGGHTRRVVGLSTRLGETLNLPSGMLDDLRQGAYLHDIGKLVIPDVILLKPGKLDADEWDIMKTHTCIGADIATSIPTLQRGAVDVIRHHHERWDGTGYPDALSGEDIPLVARIFSVIDVYDALTSTRPYKAAWSVVEARAEIERQAGRQFDPEVVRVFLDCVALNGSGEADRT